MHKIEERTHSCHWGYFLSIWLSAPGASDGSARERCQSKASPLRGDQSAGRGGAQIKASTSFKKVLWNTTTATAATLTLFRLDKLHIQHNPCPSPDSIQIKSKCKSADSHTLIYEYDL